MRQVFAAILLIALTAIGATACLMTPDGTAQLVNPPGVVTGSVDAMGCDIGIYYSVPAGAVDHAEIFGARQYGVVNDGAAVVNITNSSIHNIGDVPFDGVQSGIGIYFHHGGGGLIDTNLISFYQKEGILVDGMGTSATITNNTVRGLGPVSFIAQNGIQVSRRATGEVSGNAISENEYTGCSRHDAVKTGCTAYVAAGLLLYDVDANSIKKSNNQFRDDDANMVMVTAGSLHSGV